MHSGKHGSNPRETCSRRPQVFRVGEMARGLLNEGAMRLHPLASLASALVLATSACGGTGTTVPLLAVAGMPVTQTPTKDVPLEVVTRSTSVPDPLPVSGAGLSYADIETALGHAVATGAVPWAELHRSARPEGWQLFVELTRAEATYQSGRLLVTLEARATLRTRYSHTFLAQTHVTCKQGGLVEVERGAPVVFTCMEQLGRDVAGWLGQVEP